MDHPLSIAHYRITGKLGEGGMGAVYRATDTKLARDVAIKVLPDTYAKDPDRLMRFTREAQMLASLNHPNIATIHGIEERAIIMELVEGPTLAERIAQGPLPLDEALPIARQIAEALETAHEKGIIHRDLKPANIKITADGKVKVLDFGLAKLSDPTEANEDPASAPTVVRGNSPTLAGVIIGTAGYMSPERCLRKDLKTRLRDIGEARILLDGPLEEPASTNPPKAARWPLAATAAALAITLIVAAVGWYRATRPTPPRQLMRLNIDLDESTPPSRIEIIPGIGGNMIAFSPDGARVALTLRGADGKVRLHTRLLNQDQVKPLAGTENAYAPFFSPAGDWIAFFADDKLKKIPVEGGIVETLCNASKAFGGSWGDDGSIIAALNQSDGLSRIPSAGGTPVPVTKLNPGEVTHRWPLVLPGSQAVLFTASGQLIDYDSATIDVVSLKTGQRKTIHHGGFYPRYLADRSGASGAGHLIYLNAATLFAVPFDLGRLALAGAPSPILGDVSSNQAAGGDFAFANDGTFVYLSAKASAEAAWPISWVDRAGKTQPLHAPPGDYRTPRFSPDGKRLAFAINRDKGTEVWVKDLERDAPSRLSFLPGPNAFPVWTPDGKSIVFLSQNPAAPGLYGVRSDGSGEAKRLTESKSQQYPCSFSPDGKRLALIRAGNLGMDSFTLPVEADPGPGAFGFRLGKEETFLGTPAFEVNPMFSPDGRWVAYTSNESGIMEVYVRPFPGPGGQWQISTGGGNFAVWSPDGRELLFESLDQHVMAVSYTITRTAGATHSPPANPECGHRFACATLASATTSTLRPTASASPPSSRTARIARNPQQT